MYFTVYHTQQVRKNRRFGGWFKDRSGEVNNGWGETKSQDETKVQGKTQNKTSFWTKKVRAEADEAFIEDGTFNNATPPTEPPTFAPIPNYRHDEDHL